jgi:hypothetical protein
MARAKISRRRHHGLSKKKIIFVHGKRAFNAGLYLRMRICFPDECASCMRKAMTM